MDDNIVRSTREEAAGGSSRSHDMNEYELTLRIVQPATGGLSPDDPTPPRD